MTNELTFDEETHTYYWNNKPLISVTTVIGQYFKPFDAKAIARVKAATARKNGTEGPYPDYWISKWRDDADHGTRVHNAIEKWLTTWQTTDFLDARDKSKFTQAQKFLNKNDYKVVLPEYRVVAPNIELAGTVDLIVRNEEDGTISLIDWKTNKAISKSGFKGERVREPLSHLEACSLTKYSLQLQLYAWILENVYAESVRDLKLVHLSPTKYVEYDIPVNYDDVLLLLTDYLEANNVTA